MPGRESHPLIALCYASGSDTRRFPELLEAVHDLVRQSPRTAAALLEPLEPHVHQAAAIAEQMSAQWSEQLAATLREIFGFSDAELQIIAGLMQGESLADMAARRQRSLHTVRTQMKHLLARSPCRNQSELLQLVRGLALVVPGAAVPTQAPSAITTVLADGSQLCHYEYGAPDGRPVLLLHTALLGPELPSTVDRAARECGLRLLALARPGYSGSSPMIGPDPDLSHTCARIAEWLAARALPPLPVVGNVVGVIYAHALARICPDRLTHVFVSAGPVPLGWATTRPLPMTRRVWLQLLRRKPGLVLPFARLGVGYVRKGSARRFLQTAYPGPSTDAATLTQRGFVEGLVPAVDSAVGAGAERFVEAVSLQCHDWSELCRHPLPVTVMHGEDDDIVALDDVRAFYPDAAVYPQPDAGQLLLYRRPEAVLSVVARGMTATD